MCAGDEIPSRGLALRHSQGGHSGTWVLKAKVFRVNGGRFVACWFVEVSWGKASLGFGWSFHQGPHSLCPLFVF